MKEKNSLMKKHANMMDKIKCIKDMTDPDYMKYNSLSIFTFIFSVVAVIAAIVSIIGGRFYFLPADCALFIISAVLGYYIRSRRIPHKTINAITYGVEVFLTIFGIAIYIALGGIAGSAVLWYMLVLTFTVVTFDGENRTRILWWQIGIYIVVVLLDLFGVITCADTGSDYSNYISVIAAIICVAGTISVYIMFILSEFKNTQQRLRDEIDEVKTEKEQAEKLRDEYEKNNKIAVRALKAQEAFLSNMSHEIKTPLNAVVGLSEVIDRTDDINEVHQLSKSILGASRGLDCVISNIIEYAAKGDVDIKINNRPYNTEAIFSAVKNMCAQRLDAKGIAFEVERGATPQMLLGDIVRLQNLIFNLINEIIKHTDSGKVLFKGEYDREKQLLVLTFHGTTNGINETIINSFLNAFDEDSQIDVKPVDGAEIGLAICKRISDAMHGTLFVKSDEENGTTFIVTLPQKVFEPEGSGEGNGVASAPDFHGKRVMYVDSTKVNHLLIDSTLLDTGAFVAHEFEPKGVLDTPSEKLKAFDLFIIDPTLPSMDGEQLIIHLRGRGVKAPIVCACQNLNPETRKMYMEKGFSECIQKPIVALQLLGLCMGVFKGLKRPGDV